jgi:dTDP-4-dehydrorhamnose reductase
VLELTGTDHAGPVNVAGPQAVSRAELGLLVARRYGLDPAGLATTTSGAAGVHLPTEVRLDTSRAVGELRTRLRGAEEFLAA